MVVFCSAPGCSSKRDNVSKTIIQFHRFPLRKPDVCAKWVKAMRCPSFKPSTTSYLCSSHFLSSDFEMKPNSSVKHLKPNAVPSIFEKRRPGRKRKILTTTDSTDALQNVPLEDSDKEKNLEKHHDIKDEFSLLENSEKIESNLADIIGDRDKGTLQVLIVGEDGKITNSEYIFKKETFEDGYDDNDGDDDEFKVESCEFTQSSNLSLESSDEKSNLINDSTNKAALNCSCPLYVSKIKRLKNSLNFCKKKIEFLQMKCVKINSQNKELKLLLKLMILKRGRGVKNLNQLLDEYEKCNEIKVKAEEEEDFYEVN